jgi:tetratricopeptide (TPR) repeat protein
MFHENDPKRLHSRSKKVRLMANKMALMCLILLATLVQPVFAAVATAEVSGKVVDHEGAPIQGALVKFNTDSNPAMVYKGKTNKRGQYLISGLFTGKENEMWVVNIELEGLVPSQMVVESRTVNRVLIDKIHTVTLAPGKTIPKIVIRPLGTAKVDFTMVTPEMAATLSPAPKQPVDGESTAAAAPPQRDPYAVALTLAGDGDLEGSLKMFEKAIEKEPTDAERRQAFAQVLYRLERFDEAEPHALKAIEMTPDLVSARMVLYSIYVGAENFQQAKETLAAARQIDPENLEVLKQVAYIAQQTGLPAEEISVYETIVALHPEDAEAWIRLGDLYHAQGEDAKSGAAYEQVVAISPDGAHRIFYNLGALLMNADNPSEVDVKKAIEYFTRAIELSADYAAAHKQLAFALLNQGETSAAGDHLSKYVTLSPDAPDATQMAQMVKVLQQ